MPMLFRILPTDAQRVERRCDLRGTGREIGNVHGATCSPDLREASLMTGALAASVDGASSMGWLIDSPAFPSISSSHLIAVGAPVAAYFSKARLIRSSTASARGI